MGCENIIQLESTRVMFKHLSKQTVTLHLQRSYFSIGILLKYPKYYSSNCSVEAFNRPKSVAFFLLAVICAAEIRV